MAIGMGVQVCMTLGKWPHPAAPWVGNGKGACGRGSVRITQIGLGTAPDIKRTLPEGELVRSNGTAPHKGQVGSVPGVAGREQGRCAGNGGGGTERGGARGRAGGRARAAGARGVGGAPRGLGLQVSGREPAGRGRGGGGAPTGPWRKESLCL